MARFYASIKGSQGEATRIGTRMSGITGHIRGWNVGVLVNVYAEGDVDVVQVVRTGGSNGSGHAKILATIRSDDE